MRGIKMNDYIILFCLLLFFVSEALYIYGNVQLIKNGHSSFKIVIFMFILLFIVFVITKGG